MSIWISPTIAIPWTKQFEDKIYDGTNALTGQTVSYTDVTGKTVNVPLKAYLITSANGSPELDTASPVTAPIAAGFYGIASEITDKNYVWSNESGKFHTVHSLLLVYPKTDTIYANDTAADMNMTTSGGANTSTYTWTAPQERTSRNGT